MRCYFNAIQLPEGYCRKVCEHVRNLETTAMAAQMAMEPIMESIVITDTVRVGQCWTSKYEYEYFHTPKSKHCWNVMDIINIIAYFILSFICETAQISTIIVCLSHSEKWFRRRFWARILPSTSNITRTEKMTRRFSSYKKEPAWFMRRMQEIK